MKNAPCGDEVAAAYFLSKKIEMDRLTALRILIESGFQITKNNRSIKCSFTRKFHTEQQIIEASEVLNQIGGYRFIREISGDTQPII